MCTRSYQLLWECRVGIDPASHAGMDRGRDREGLDPRKKKSSLSFSFECFEERELFGKVLSLNRASLGEKPGLRRPPAPGGAEGGRREREKAELGNDRFQLQLVGLPFSLSSSPPAGEGRGGGWLAPRKLCGRGDRKPETRDKS